VADELTTVTEQPAQAVTPAPQTATPSQLIYCGPTLPSEYGLRQYQTFIGGLPERITEIAKDCPAITSLFVAVIDFAKTRIAAGQKGTVEYSLYQTVLQYFRKG